VAVVAYYNFRDRASVSRTLGVEVSPTSELFGQGRLSITLHLPTTPIRSTSRAGSDRQMRDA